MTRRQVAVAGLVLVAAGCKAHAAPDGGQAAPAATGFAVDPAPVIEKTLDVVVTLPAELAPYEAVDIYARANGFVATVQVDRGSVVKQGALLARLEAPELSSQRMEAEAKLAADRTTLDRLQAAAKQTPGAVAQNDIDVADAAARASAAKVSSLRTLESYLVVKAPFEGVVTERNIHPGALVGPASGKGPPMLRLEQLTKLRLTVAVPEGETSAIHEGDMLDFSVPAWPQRKFHATVVRVAHAVDTKTRTMPVELDVDNKDGALASGMYATVYWHARRPEPTLFVPDSAVVQGTAKTFVVRVSGGKADQVVVQRGVPMEGVVEVFGDLHPGDIVAKRGSEELKPGTPVTIRSAGGKSP